MQCVYELKQLIKTNIDPIFILKGFLPSTSLSLHKLVAFEVGNRRKHSVIPLSIEYGSFEHKTCDLTNPFLNTFLPKLGGIEVTHTLENPCIFAVKQCFTFEQLIS